MTYKEKWNGNVFINVLKKQYKIKHWQSVMESMTSKYTHKRKLLHLWQTSMNDALAKTNSYLKHIKAYLCLKLLTLSVYYYFPYERYYFVYLGNKSLLKLSSMKLCRWA